MKTASLVAWLLRQELDDWDAQVLKHRSYARLPVNDRRVERAKVPNVPQVLQEWNNPGTEGKFVRRFRVPWLEGESEHKIPVNLAGEPYAANQIRFSVLPGAIRVVLPPDCPCIQ